MDTSETYIKKADCPEIQANWIAKGGDIFYWRMKKKTQMLVESYDEDFDFGKVGVWLPHQDQLQEMLKFEYDRTGGRQTSDYDLIIRLHNYYFNEMVGLSRKEIFQISMEQLWLAFVMKEKHNKVWDGEKWNG